MTTDRPSLTLDHYKDAVALLRATLAGDDVGALAVVQGAEVSMMFQAIVKLHLGMLLEDAGGNARAVDAFLADFLARAAEVDL